MKQLILTITNPIGTQQEVKDFLVKCQHSPQWIGDPEQWEIKHYTFYNDSKGHNNVSALLENDNWNEPVATALTYRQIYDILKDNRDKTLYVGIRKGLSTNKIDKYIYGEVRTWYGIIEFDKQNNRPQITIEDLFDALGLYNFDEFVDDPDTVSVEEFLFNYKEKDPELLETLSKIPAKVKCLQNVSSGHPITEIVENDGDIVLIYNQDIIC